MNKKHNIKWAKLGLAGAFLLITVTGFFVEVSASANFSFSMTPMKEELILNPGDNYSSSIDIYVPRTYETDLKYSAEVGEYYVDENYNNIFEDCDSTYCAMKDWITIDSASEGRVSPGETITISYTINVPDNAAGGGQYASILVTGNAWDDATEDGSEAKDDESTATVTEIKRMAHTIYAEVTGDSNHNGEIIGARVPGFLLSGNIRGDATVKNTGNVHGEATYKLQVFPLFSNEEVYTNEENPQTSTILPERSRYNVIEWKDTPSLGIFNVIYTAEFEGVTTEVKKMVIICPIWLLIIIIIAIIALVVWLYTRSKSRKK